MPEKEIEKIPSTKKPMPALVLMLFIISYVAVWIFSSASSTISSVFSGVPVLNIFSNPPLITKSLLYLIAPAIGFFLAFFAVDLVAKRLSSIKNIRVIFPIAFVVLALFSFYLGLYWYSLPAVASNTGIDGIAVCIDSDHCNQMNKDFQSEDPPKTIYTINYSNAFSASSFYLFTIGALLGWFSNFVLFALSRKNIL